MSLPLLWWQQRSAPGALVWDGRIAWGCLVAGVQQYLCGVRSCIPFARPFLHQGVCLLTSLLVLRLFLSVSSSVCLLSEPVRHRLRPWWDCLRRARAVRVGGCTGASTGQCGMLQGPAGVVVAVLSAAAAHASGGMLQLLRLAAVG